MPGDSFDFKKKRRHFALGEFLDGGFTLYSEVLFDM